MTQNEKILERLKSAGPAGCTTSELFAGLYCTKYTSRISELRAKGWHIEANKIQGSDQWRYRLRGFFQRHVETSRTGFDDLVAKYPFKADVFELVEA